MARKQMKKSTTRATIRTGRPAPKKTTVRARSTSPRSVSKIHRTVSKPQAALQRPRTQTPAGGFGLGLGLELDLSALNIVLGDIQNALRTPGAKGEELINSALSRMYDYAEELRHEVDEQTGGAAQKAYDKAVNLLNKARDEGWNRAQEVLEKLGVEIESKGESEE